MGNFFGKNPYQNLDDTQKRKLNLCLNEILRKDSINHDNQEFQDITTAVCIMLQMAVQRITDRGIFRVARMQPCGSMIEKTSMWKLDKETGEPFTEFDFLAILEETVESVPDHRCLVCQPVQTLPVNFDCLRKHYAKAVEYLRDDANTPLKINHLFVQELAHSVISLCDCFSVRYEMDDTNEIYHRRISFNKKGPTCGQCRVDMPTGTLRINTCIDIEAKDPSLADCSLIFIWTSKVHSLIAPADLTLQTSKAVASLPIYVDCLPALQLDSSTRNENELHDLYLVAKRCHSCTTANWRKSSCASEINYMQHHMTEKHRNCFKILKYLFKVCQHRGNHLMYLNQYHVKNIVFLHDMESSDCQRDIAECVLKMLLDLVYAYKSGRMRSAASGANLIGMSGVYESRYEYIRQIIDRLCSVSDQDSCEAFAQKLTADLSR